MASLWRTQMPRSTTDSASEGSAGRERIGARTSWGGGGGGGGSGALALPTSGIHEGAERQNSAKAPDARRGSRAARLTRETRAGPGARRAPPAKGPQG